MDWIKTRILLKKQEAQLRYDVLPDGDERKKLRALIEACEECLTETQQNKSHRSPRQTICAQCEDKNNPVIKQVDGFSFKCEIINGVTVEIFLHDDCASTWYDAFSAYSRITDDRKRYRAHA